MGAGAQEAEAKMDRLEAGTPQGRELPGAAQASRLYGRSAPAGPQGPPDTAGHGLKLPEIAGQTTARK